MRRKTLEKCICMSMQENCVKSIIAVSQIFPEGQKIVAAVVEYQECIDNFSLTPCSFKVKDRKVMAVHTSDKNTHPRRIAEGPFVIIELSSDTMDACVLQRHRNRERVYGGKEPNEKMEMGDCVLEVQQVMPIFTEDGTELKAWSAPEKSDRDINLIVDRFLKLKYQDPDSGIELAYNLFVPWDYDDQKKYPMVVFMHDLSAIGDNQVFTLLQGNGATVWATEDEQYWHQCFVLAPQYSRRVVSNDFSCTEEVDATLNLIHSTCDRMSVDRDRIYVTGQGMGCMMAMQMGYEQPDLFAAYFLMAGQWDPKRMAPMAYKPMFLIASQADERAVKGLTADVEALEKAGAKVDRALWGIADGCIQQRDADALTRGDGNIKLAILDQPVFRNGSCQENCAFHEATWQMGYDIAAVRAWLFRQKKGNR